MNKDRYLYFKSIGVLVLIAILTTGCSTWKLGESGQRKIARVEKEKLNKKNTPACK